MVSKVTKTELIRLIEAYRWNAQRHAVLEERHESGLDNGPNAAAAEQIAYDEQNKAWTELTFFIKHNI